MAVNAELLDLTEELEYGLGCPDGTVIWPPQSWHGYPIATAQDRNGFADILLAAGKDMNVDPTAFARAFMWVPRSRTTIVLSKVAETALDMGVTFDVPVTDGEPTPNE